MMVEYRFYIGMVIDNEVVIGMGKCDCDFEDMSLPESVGESLRRRGGIEGLVSDLPDQDSIIREVNLHKALSDPNRLKLLHMLAISECCPCVLKRALGLADSKLSYHLSKLESQGLVEFYREQNWRIYRITEFGRSNLI